MWIGHGLEQFSWTVCNLVGYSDGDRDEDRKISEMNSV